MRERMIKWVAFCGLLFISFTATAQNKTDSCTLEISLLTCAPGTDLYSLFGHTAIRVRDRQRGMDVVYNYGTFDDSDPLFYFHFTRGIMVYSLSAETFNHFMGEYEYDHRAVISQTLNLSCEQKKTLYTSLRENTTESNRYYNYQFYNDNCTTRAGKIIVANSSQPLQFENILPDPRPTYRQLIHVYLDRQKQWWSGFGIDMLLGSHMDKKTSNEDAIYFLPDYLMTGFDHARTATGPLVLNKQNILQFPESKTSAAWITPLSVFIFLFLFSILLSVISRNWTRKSLQIFDVVLFSVLGIIGLVMLYLWLVRIDIVCRNNINILWALPTHIIAVFFLRKEPHWLKYYFLVTAIFAAILLLGFAWWPQQMNRAMIPLLLIIIFRSIQQYLKESHAKDRQSFRAANPV
ncbi:MAG TPA: DUF4105 domain-containing protein [Puia sp.]|nr:DUF4105 domain-containing protein [Puia sp.]